MTNIEQILQEFDQNYNILTTCGSDGVEYQVCEARAEDGSIGFVRENNIRNFIHQALLKVQQETRESMLSKQEIRLLSDLRELCIDDDLLDLDAYDSISRGDKISNAWAALDVIDKIIKQLKEEQ